MGKTNFVSKEEEMASYHQERWLNLCDIVEYRHKEIHPEMSHGCAQVIERILHRLSRTQGHLRMSIEEIEYLCGGGRQKIYRSINMLKKMGFCRVSQKRKGGLFHFVWLDAEFERLEVKVRFGKNVVRFQRHV